MELRDLSDLESHRPRHQSDKEAWTTFVADQKSALEKNYVNYAYAFQAAADQKRRGTLSSRARKRFCAIWIADAFKIRGFKGYRVNHEEILASWVMHRLGERRPGGAKLGFAPTTMQLRFAIVANLILPKVRQTHLRSDELKSIGRKTAVSFRSSSRIASSVRSATQDFADYVRGLPGREESESEISYRAEQFDDGAEIDRGPSTAVAADILSELEFQDFIKRLKEEPNGIELRLISILGYRAGLRLPEALGLLVSDFVCVDGQCDLIINHNYLRELKTPKSRRVLPLATLLPPCELVELRAWLDLRTTLHSFIKGQELTVFGPILTRTIHSYWQYKSVLETALGSESKGYGRFEILRHSFGSYLLTNLLAPTSAVHRLIPLRFRGNISFERRADLVDSFLGRERLGKSSLHAVSQAMGHTGIHRTLESYQHLLELSLGMFVNRSLDEFDVPDNPAGTAEETTKYKAPKPRTGARHTNSPKDDRSNPCSPFEFEHDWTTVWTVLTKGKAGVNRLRAHVILPDSDVRKWTRIANSATSEFFKRIDHPAKISLPLGAHAEFVINRLWRNKRRPTKSEARAISHYIWNADHSNNSSQLASLGEVASLAMYLKDCGVYSGYMSFDPGKTVPQVEEDLARLSEFRNLDLGDGHYPRFEFNKQAGGSDRPLGYSADLARNASALDRAHEQRLEKERLRGDRAFRQNEIELPRRDPDHLHVVYALRLGVLLLACYYGLKPAYLPHAQNKNVQMALAAGRDPTKIKSARQKNAPRRKPKAPKLRETSSIQHEG